MVDSARPTACPQPQLLHLSSIAYEEAATPRLGDGNVTADVAASCVPGYDVAT